MIATELKDHAALPSTELDLPALEQAKEAFLRAHNETLDGPTASLAVYLGVKAALLEYQNIIARAA